MKRVLALRPSPALVIACIALFIALGGVSHAVATAFIDSREIRDNTVRTEDLRNNDIRAIDIRNSTIRGRDVAFNTLTGGDIAETKLGRVPSAATADDASKLGGVAAAGYLRRDSTPFVALPPATGWTTVPGETTPGYFLDPIGFVHLHGVLRRVSGVSELAITLPPQGRPSVIKRLPIYGESLGGPLPAAGINVNVNGDVFVKAPNEAASNLISLEGATFRAGD